MKIFWFRVDVRAELPNNIVLTVGSQLCETAFKSSRLRSSYRVQSNR